MQTYLIIAALLVFCFFNFRPRGKARCFAGDVGSVGIAFILLFALGFIYLCPLLAEHSQLALVAWHWIYLLAALVLLSLAYLLFMKKYYHLHAEYLASLGGDK